MNSEKTAKKKLDDFRRYCETLHTEPDTGKRFVKVFCNSYLELTYNRLYLLEAIRDIAGNMAVNKHTDYETMSFTIAHLASIAIDTEMISESEALDNLHGLE